MIEFVTSRNNFKTIGAEELSSIPSAALLLLIFLALFVPTVYVAFKACLMVIIAIGILANICSGKYFLPRDSCYAVLAFSVTGLLNSIHGEMNGAPGATRVLTVMSLWPLFYLLSAIQLNQKNAVRWINSAFTVALEAIIIYSLIFLGSEFGIVPDVLYLRLDQGNAYGIYDGYIEYSLFNISSLLFLVPLAVHRLANRLRARQVGASFKIIIETGTLFLALMLCLLSGRRALQFVVLSTPILIITSESILGHRGRTFLQLLFSWRALTIVTLTFAASVLFLGLVGVNIDPQVLLVNMLDGFNFTGGSEEGASVRYEQYDSLMRAWWNGNILIGAGNGSCTEVLRDTEGMPWSYELTYVYILFSTGIAGSAFYVTWFVWGLVRLRHALALRTDLLGDIAPIVTGVFAFLIATASNPYLGKFDYLWIAFLPHLIAGSIQFQNKELMGKVAVTR
jgi:hypothetical protein